MNGEKAAEECWKHPGRPQQRMCWHAQSPGNQIIPRTRKTGLQAQEIINPCVLQQNTTDAQETHMATALCCCPLWTKTGCDACSNDIKPITCLKPSVRLKLSFILKQAMLRRCRMITAFPSVKYSKKEALGQSQRVTAMVSSAFRARKLYKQNGYSKSFLHTLKIKQ